MNLRRLAADAGIVAVLAAATAAYLRQPDNGWSFLSPGPKEIFKYGGEAVWHAELARWWTASAVGMAAMLLRGRWPLAALAGTVAMALVHVGSDTIPLLPLDTAPAIALFAVANGGTSRRVSFAALAVTLVLAFVPALWVDRMPAVLSSGGAAALLPPATVALAWLSGDRNRARREAAVRQARELERQRDEQAYVATAAERARIARELHDAVAHGLSIIVIQAQAGAGALDQRPGPARSAQELTARGALAAIETTGREALTEMRRLLGLDRPDEADLSPLPGTADLPGLAARVTATGLPVDLTVTGDLGALPTGVGLSTYRIVQEALTNALKHAGPGATVRVDVRGDADAVELTVADSGRGAGGQPDERHGNGLRNMRERVAVLGGTLTAGDRPEGGFRIHARLPLADLP